MRLHRHIEQSLEVSIGQVNQFARTAPKMYKVYTIPKKTRGHRVIAHPSKELKRYQRSVCDYLSGLLPVHDSAHAYVKGKGIKTNATAHKQNPYLLKMDFSNFFNSIDPAYLYKFVRRGNIEITNEELGLLRGLLFWSPSRDLRKRRVLSVGAPSSPFISNALLFDFDKEISEWCRGNEIVYTRYADDITFSTRQKGRLFNVPAKVKTLIAKSSFGSIFVNDAKTIFSSRAHNRHVTGVTISNEGKLSLGRARKRYISSLIHKYRIGILDEELELHLRGLLAFAMDIEPSFIAAINKKYGAQTISEILKG